MEKIVRILVFSEKEEVDLKELSRRFLNCIIQEEENIEKGKRAILIYGPEDEIIKIRRGLTAEEIIPGEEEQIVIDFIMNLCSGDTVNEAKEVIREDLHDLTIDLSEEIENDS